jgi:site-specific DNA-methyltransferase (adenine-specific)/modification methylase
VRQTVKVGAGGTAKKGNEVAEKVVIGNAELWLGDCRDILPLVAADCVITDPPYGLGDRMQGGTWGSADKYKDLVGWDSKPEDDLLRVLADGAKKAVFWGGNYFDLPPSRCWLVWDKQNAVPTMADCEMAWTNLDANTKRLSLPVGRHDSGHPSEKPLRLMEWTLQAVKASGVVLDPFMGSGTTGVACIGFGLSFVGIERERKYFDIACERIARAQAQGQLLPPEQKPVAVQEALL